jgi:hypothetical protein
LQRLLGKVPQKNEDPTGRYGSRELKYSHESMRAAQTLCEASVSVWAGVVVSEKSLVLKGGR